MSKGIFLAIYMTCLMGAMAQQTFISLDQFTDYAILHNPSIQQAILNEKIEQQNRRAALAPMLPLANAQGTITDNVIIPTTLIPAEAFGGPAGTFRPIKFGTQYGINPSGNVTLNLINAANYQNLSIAKKNQELATASTQLSIEQIKTSIAQAYYQYLLTRSNYDFATRNLANADTLLRITKVRYDNQYIDELDFNRSSSSELQSQNQVDATSILAEKALNSLKLLAGMDVKEKLIIKDELAVQDIPLSELLASSSVNRPEIKAQMLKLNVSEMSILREKLKFSPELAASANYGINGQNNNFKFAESSQKWYQSGSLGLALTVPIFAGGVKYYNVQKAKLNKQVAELDLANTRLKTDKEDRDLALDFLKAKNDLKVRQKQLRYAERNYDLALVKYRNQSLAYDNLVNIQNELLSAQQSLLQAEADYVTSQYKIKLINSYDKK